MKKSILYLTLYLLFFIVATLGNVLYSNVSGAVGKSYRGGQWLFIIGGLTLIFLVLIIIVRTLINTSLQKKSAIALNCVFVLVSAALLLLSLLSTKLYNVLPINQAVFPYLMLIILTSDMFNLLSRFSLRNNT